MPTSDDLKAAVAEGILDAAQADRLTAFIAARSQDDPWDSPVGQLRETEDVRFVRGFHDIFIAIGVALLFGGLASAGFVTGNIVVVLAASAVLAWGMSEFLTLKRRLVLPSIVLCVAFVLSASGAVWGAFGQDFFEVVKEERELVLTAASATGLCAAAIFFFRFRLPFVIGVIAAGAIAVAVSVLLYIEPAIVRDYRTAILLVSGICTFAAAMAFDLSDPDRETLRSDNAFWLHLLAAPLLVHSILTLVSLGKNSGSDIAGAAAVIAVVLVLALVALLVDRRAMLVVGLSYLGTAIATVIREMEVETSTVAAITLIILGAGVVALGSGWQASRSVLFRVLPLPPGLRDKLPPVRGQS